MPGGICNARLKPIKIVMKMLVCLDVFQSVHQEIESVPQIKIFKL